MSYTRRSRITTIRRDGLEFEVYDAGPIDGDVIVLLHGCTQTPDDFAAGTRMNASLFHTPAAISVLTKEFLDDIGAENVAAFIGEPVQGAGGVIDMPITYDIDAQAFRVNIRFTGTITDAEELRLRPRLRNDDVVALLERQGAVIRFDRSLSTMHEVADVAVRVAAVPTLLAKVHAAL